MKMAKLKVFDPSKIGVGKITAGRKAEVEDLNGQLNEATQESESHRHGVKVSDDREVSYRMKR